MLIDEFDSILDPTKSNFNIIKKSENSLELIYDIIKPIFSKKSIAGNFLINEENKLLSNDIKSILEQINNKTLVENINWGIHPHKLYAIPYRSKDCPLLNSFFSSGVITVFLTLYYFIVINKYQINDLIVKYIIEHNIVGEYFKIPNPIIISCNFIEELLDEEYKKLDFFEYLFNKIFMNLKLTSKQYNTSFVDILNIDGLFKIGYSGTLNIDLPDIFSNIETFNDCEKVHDYDEKVNIEHAISESNIINYQYKENRLDFFDDICIDNFDALIDTIGLFKNFKNEEIAFKINDYFKKLRIIIFIDEQNEIFIINGNNLKSYNEQTNYDNPFIYYDQAHIVGIDIKQDFYPNMNGLCVVNDTSEYTVVAQSMCRLRKLNMGHVITFLYIGIINKVDDLLKKINLNESESKKSKLDSLIYQTLKSEVRKSNLILEKECFIENYVEDVKFYFLEDEESKIYKLLNNEIKDYIYEDFLVNIINIDKSNYKIMNLLKYINNLDKLKQLIYNIGIMTYTTQQEQYNEEDINIKRKKTIDTEMLSISFALNPLVKLKFDYQTYDFSNLHPYFIDYTIGINEYIRCLPNIFSQASYCNIESYNYKLLFVLFEEYNNLLIIPFYLVIYFNENYHIFDDKLNKINFKKGNFNIDCFKELDFFKILSGKNIENVNEYSLTYESSILYSILCIKNPHIGSQINFLKNYRTYDSLIIKFNKIFNDQINQYFSQFIDDYMHKYLKYKNKYLFLKNKLK
jgi:hypothetical protein